MKALLVFAAAVVTTVFTALHPSPAFGVWWPNGLPIAGSARVESQPIIARDDAGGAFIAWQSYEDGAPYYYVTRIAADGQPAPGWSLEGVELPGPGYSGEIMPDGAGGVLLSWVHYAGYGFTGGVAATRLTAAGDSIPGWPQPGPALGASKSNETHPESPRTWGALFPASVTDGAGGLIIAWTYVERFWDFVHVTQYSGDGSIRAVDPFTPTYGFLTRVCSDNESGAFMIRQTAGMFLHHLLGTGVLDPSWPAVGVTVSTDVQSGSPGVCPDGSGGVFVAWLEQRGGSGQQYVISRFDASGAIAPGWPEGGIVLSTHECRAGGYRVGQEFFDQRYTSMVADGTGGTLIAWQDARADTGDIYVQRILADGDIAPGWPAEGLLVCGAPGLQRYPVLASNGGGAVVAWQDERTQSDSDIYAQIILADGTLPAGARGITVCNEVGYQELPQIADDGAGGAFVVWTDRRNSIADVFAWHLTLDGVVSTQASLVVAEATPGQVHLEWMSSRASGSRAEISRRQRDRDWSVLAALDADASGRFIWRDRAVTPGKHYSYRLGQLIAGRVEYTAEVEIDVPPALEFAIETVKPNPTNGNLTVDFALPDAEAVRLEVIDIQGRVWERRHIESVGPGHHALRMALRGRLPTGLYWAQLSQRGVTKRLKFAVVQ